MAKDFLGKVIYNEDPTFSGRCKVRVFSIFDELPDHNIPWFVPGDITIFSGEGGGNISIPKVGDIVKVTFTNNDYYSGEYHAIQNLDPNLIAEIKDDYLDTHVLLYDSDKDLIVIYQPKTGLKMYLNGSVIVIDADGMIQMKHKNNANVIEITNDAITIVSGNNSKINLQTDGEVNIEGGNIKIKSSNVEIGSGGQSFSAVKGEQLVLALQSIVADIAAKYAPPGSTNLGNTFQNILSSEVKVH